MTGTKHNILITVDDLFSAAVSPDELVRITAAVLAAEGIGDAEVGVYITGDETVRDLNRRYAGEDKPTDVLSFSLQEGEEFASPDDLLRLGEVIISYPTAERQAREAGRETSAEVAHLLVHGLLHLLGYDHAEPEDESVMKAREQELLGRTG